MASGGKRPPGPGRPGSPAGPREPSPGAIGFGRSAYGSSLGIHGIIGLRFSLLIIVKHRVHVDAGESRGDLWYKGAAPERFHHGRQM